MYVIVKLAAACGLGLGLAVIGAPWWIALPAIVIVLLVYDAAAAYLLSVAGPSGR